MHALFSWHSVCKPALLLFVALGAGLPLHVYAKDTAKSPTEVLGQPANPQANQQNPDQTATKWGKTQADTPAAQSAATSQNQTTPATTTNQANPANQANANQGMGARERQAREAQAIFEESLRQMMPLSKGQIQEFREHSDQRDRALLPVSPALNARTVRVSLEPGQAPVDVFTTANIATSLVFHDATGQPWPVTSVTNGGPQFFQILRPDLPEGNLLNVMPSKGYATSTIVVTLEGRDIPLVVRLESDSVRAPSRKADALVLFQLAHHGPRAATPIIANIKETASSTMLAFLDRVPPKDAVRVRADAKGGTITVWSLNDKHYIRTNQTLVWPAWSAVVNGPANTKCYEIPKTARIMLSINGKIETVLLKNTQK